MSVRVGRTRRCQASEPGSTTDWRNSSLLRLLHSCESRQMAPRLGTSKAPSKAWHPTRHGTQQGMAPNGAWRLTRHGGCLLHAWLGALDHAYRYASTGLLPANGCIPHACPCLYVYTSVHICTRPYTSVHTCPYTCLYAMPKALGEYSQLANPWSPSYPTHRRA